MKTSTCSLVIALTGLAGLASPASGQDVGPAIRNAARCAATASTSDPPANAPRIVGAQDTQAKMLFAARDLLILNAGVEQGAHVGQLFVIRRHATFGRTRTVGPRAVTTTGWLHIIAANETTAIGQVDYACDAIAVGDYLEPYVEALLPPGIDRTDAAGEADFTSPARILFGENERTTGGSGDFMIVDAGSLQGMQPGFRFAIYRDVHQAGIPLALVGEAVAVRVEEKTTVVRITNARDAVQAGDFVARRAQSGR